MISQYRYTDTEMRKLLRSLTVVVDTREQNNKHITDYFTARRILHVSQKLDYGDYACFLPANAEFGLVRDTYIDCFVERKGSLEELSGNFCNDRTRFESELLRAKDKRLILMIEEQAGLEKIIGHKYQTEYNEKSFLASLFTFAHRHGVDVHFIDKKYAGLFIYYQMYYAAREILKT